MTIIGKPINRVDGPAKVTGQAHYSAEIPLQHITHAVLVGSTIANGRIKHIDTSRVEQAPGVIKVLTHLNTPTIAQPAKLLPSGLGGPAPGQSFFPMQGPEIHYAGQHIALVIAETLDQAEYAASLLDVVYDAQTPMTSVMAAANQVYQPNTIFAGLMPGEISWGDTTRALNESPVKIEATYTFAMNHHNPIEPSATTAVWEDQTLTLYDATQGINATQLTVAQLLGISPDRVRVITQYVGGGFGCKAMIWSHQTLAAMAAQIVQRPVKLVLTRPQMFTSCGHREEQMQELTLGATYDGYLTAIRHIKTSGTSTFDDWAEPSIATSSMMYTCPHYEGKYQLVHLNTMTPTFMRGPGEATGMFALECSMDELATALDLDPIEIRMRNHADVDPATGMPWSSKSLKACYTRGAELFGWEKRNPQPRSMHDGRHLVGYGMASATYPVYLPAQAQSARARLFANGHAVIQSGTQDFGTGSRTVMTQVAADMLGLPLECVHFELGDTNYPTTVASVGSQGAGATSSAVALASQALRAKIINVAIKDGLSPLYGLDPSSIEVIDGYMFASQNPALGDKYTDVMARNMLYDVEAVESWQPPEVDPHTSLLHADGKEFAIHSFGAQFAEVRVDPDLGVVRMHRLIGVFAAGRILNMKTAKSQLMGGMIWGLSQALLEGTYIDHRYGRMTNNSMAEYLLPVHADIKDITIDLIEEHDPYINTLGVKGIGELGQIGMAAAIANAIYHATGTRVRNLPILLEHLL